MHPEASGRDAADALIDAAAAALTTTGAELLRAMVTDSPVGTAVLDLDLRWRYANPAFTRATGLLPPDLRGGGLAGTPFAPHADALRQVLADGHRRALRNPTPPEAPDDPVPAEHEPSAHCARLVVDGRTAGLLLTLVATPESSAAQRHQLVQAVARLALLDTATDRIGTTLEVDTTCAELAEFAVPTLADLATVDILPPEAADRRGPTGSARPTHPSRSALPRLHRAAVSCTPELRPQLAALAVPGESVRYPEDSAAAQSLLTGKPVPGNQLTGDELGRFAGDAATLTAYQAADVDAVLVLPLAVRGHTVGALSLARVRGSVRDSVHDSARRTAAAGAQGVARDPGAAPGFSEDDVLLAQDVAHRAATSIDNARRYARSQGIALELQRALLAEPGNPHPNLELASRYLPSGTSSVVGGDWYESIRLSFGRTLLVIGDVMGHGVEAAVDMSDYRSMLRYIAATDLPPHRILRQLDTLISENDSARPATCLLALADPARRRWTLSSAGHLPPLLITADRPGELIEVPTSPPLGTGFGGYQQITCELFPEQVLLLYTDGLVERRGEDIDVSLARLAALRPPVTGDLEELLDAVLHGLAPHAAEDDTALLAARVRRR